MRGSAQLGTEKNTALLSAGNAVGAAGVRGVLSSTLHPTGVDVFNGWLSISTRTDRIGCVVL